MSIKTDQCKLVWKMCFCNACLNKNSTWENSDTFSEHSLLSSLHTKRSVNRKGEVCFIINKNFCPCDNYGQIFVSFLISQSVATVSSCNMSWLAHPCKYLLKNLTTANTPIKRTDAFLRFLSKACVT